MFLSMTMARNPELLAAAATLHRERVIGPDTYVLDLDRVLGNARTLSAEAEKHGLSLYFMTKQAGRNPFLALAALRGGIPAAVAVETLEARLLHAHDVPLGNVGHLVQVPAADATDVVRMRPEVITAFSVEGAASISRAAASEGLEQPLLLRVLDEDDFAYPGQEGGFRVAELPAAAEQIGSLPNVGVAGVTAFPCLLFDEATGTVQPTPNLASLLRGAESLRRHGVDIWQINAPSVTCAATIPLLAERGATHGEPGSALAGQTPLHAVSPQPEIPAMVYVSEVASTRGDLAYCIGGGFYARSRAAHALLYPGSGAEPISTSFEGPPAGSIDYYGTIHLPPGTEAHVGDTVLFAFRAQAFVSRSRVAAVGGIARSTPEVLGICDARGNLLGEEGLPIGAAEARTRVHDAWERYARETTVSRPA